MMKNKSTEIRMGTHLVWVLAIVGFLTLATTIGFYWSNFGKLGVSPDQNHWGTMGDFIGGIANPIIALLALIGLLITINLQREEFKNVTKGMEEQTEKLEEQVDEAARQRKESDLAIVLDHLGPELDRLYAMRIPVQNTNFKIDDLLTHRKLFGEGHVSSGNCWHKFRSLAEGAEPSHHLNSAIEKVRIGTVTLSSVRPEWRNSAIYYFLHQKLEPLGPLFLLVGEEIPSILRKGPRIEQHLTLVAEGGTFDVT